MKFLNFVFKPGIFGDMIALIAGAILPLAFAPFGIAILAIFSPALLLASWLLVSKKRAFFRGWLFGLGFYGIGVSWIYISLHVYGNASVFFATLATIVFVLIFSLYPAVQGYLLNWIFPKNNLSKCVLAFPASWVLLEWIRSWLFTGFPWLLLGYSQINTPLRGLAPILGIYGISLAVVFISAALVAIFYFRNKRWQIILLVLIILIWASSAILTKIHWTQAKGDKIKVSLIQGNIPQQLKWQPYQVQTILNTYQQLTAKNWDSKIIIWPEGAITINNIDAANFIDFISQTAKQHDVAVFAGIPLFLNNQYYNGAIVMGKGKGIYEKRHLVPYGEYFPFRSLLEIFKDHVQIPMSDFSRGSKNQSADFIINGVTAAAFICYEIIFPAEVLRSLPKAQLLITISDDSWYGKSIAAAQHLEMAQMRALETGRYLLFSTNNGITAIITPNGKIAAIAPTFEQYVLTDNVQAMVGSTPYVFTGNHPIIIILFILLGVAGWRKIIYKKNY